MPEPLNQPALTSALTVGMRVVLRHRTGGGLTDALGEVTAASPVELVVQTRRGPVTVARDTVVAAKEVPPAPVRRGAPHLAISMADLQEVMVTGMPPLRSAWLGKWLLRESDTYTGRANSALPLGDPGLPLDEALPAVIDWYVDRGQVPLLQICGPDGFAVSSEVVGAAALDAGWTAFQRTLVLTASVERLVALAPVEDESAVRVTDRPGTDWWAGAAEREQDHRSTAENIFAEVEDGGYIVLTGDSGPVAVGRVAYASAWVGVFCVHVQPACRRAGLARQVMAVAARDAHLRGVRSMYLQVSRDNEAAVALYRSLGFRIHHEYWYLRAPPDRHLPSAPTVAH